MRKNNFNKVDLNLLRVLSEIDRCGSVTAAAEALGLGQPAVSQALSRLRLTFNDELFVRSSGGMAATPRALELIGPIRTSLAQIEESIFGPLEFDKRESDVCFRIGASDYAAAILAPKIFGALELEMPNASVAIKATYRKDAEALLSAWDIDIALGLFPQNWSWIKKRKLYDERHVCVFNPHMNSLSDPLTLAEYVNQDHLLVSLDGSASGFVDSILAEMGESRRIKLTTPYFLQSGYLMERLPLVATLPSRFATNCSTLSKMQFRTLPFDKPQFSVSAIWRAGDEKRLSLSSLLDVIFNLSF